MKHPKYLYFYAHLSKVMRHCLLMCVALNAVVLVGQPKDAWAITGKALGSDGIPMANTRVSATLLSANGIKGAPPVVTQGISTRTFTATDGSFQINGSGLGDYVICIQPLKDAYLDPCHWSSTPKVVSIRSGGSQPAIVVTSEKGATVTVRVIDPKSQLVDAVGKPNGTVLVGYYTANTNLFYLLPQTASTGKEFTYQMTVPIATPVRFSLSSSDVVVSDNQGKAINASGQHFSMNVGRGQPNQEITFNVQSLAKKP